MDKIRIGQGVNWPKLTVTGQTYQRPISTLDLGNGYFVVLDPFRTPQRDAAVAEAQAWAKSSSATMTRSKVKSDDASE